MGIVVVQVRRLATSDFGELCIGNVVLQVHVVLCLGMSDEVDGLCHRLEGGVMWGKTLTTKGTQFVSRLQTPFSPWKLLEKSRVWGNEGA